MGAYENGVTRFEILGFKFPQLTSDNGELIEIFAKFLTVVPSGSR